MGRERAILLQATEPSPVAVNTTESAALPSFDRDADPVTLARNATEDFDQCLEAKENERRRLVQELHDSTGYLFLELAMEIGKLRKQAGFEAAGKLIDAIDEAASQIDREIRSMAFIRYPQELGDDGLEDALDMLARGFGRRTGLDVRFLVRCERAVQGESATALLRIAQEALTNVHRHAHATRVTVTLAEQRGRIMLRICDNGVGLGADFNAAGGGVGIRGMAHRSERLGGRFAIHPLKRGTAVIATVPCPVLAV